MKTNKTITVADFKGLKGILLKDKVFRIVLNELTEWFKNKPIILMGSVPYSDIKVQCNLNDEVFTYILDRLVAERILMKSKVPSAKNKLYYISDSAALYKKTNRYNNKFKLIFRLIWN